MVVDDDEKILFAFQKVIEREGHQSVLARDGEEALKLLDATQPHLVFLDLMLPDTDGFEVFGRIKKINQWLPIIIITGHATPPNECKAKLMGAFAFMSKPLSIDLIRKVLSNALAGN
jgi:DNA-binding NtrC family response regulator